MDTAAEAFDWSNLSALGTLMALVLWFATKGLPSIMEKWERQAEAARVDFRDVVNSLVAESKDQRTEFRDEMRLHREHSQKLAVSGHDLVKSLTDQLTDLKEEVKKSHDSSCDRLAS